MYVYVNRADGESGTGGWEVHASSKMLAVGHRASVISVTVGTVCCSVLQCVALCVAVCCSVLQCVAVCCSVCCSVLQCVAVCCGMLQRVCCYQIVFVILATFGGVCCSVLQRVLQCVVQPYVLQCVTVCCGALRCVAACVLPAVGHHASVIPLEICNTLQQKSATQCNTHYNTLQHCRASIISSSAGSVAACCSVLQRFAVCCRVLQCVAACLSSQYLPAALQCVAACCSVLQRVAACV